jgi:hypothetical protein
LARQAFAWGDIYQRTPDKLTHTHTHTHTDTSRSVSACLAPYSKSSRRQLLLLWCYACNLITTGRRVRSTAQHLTVRQGLKLDFVRQLLAGTQTHCFT